MEMLEIVENLINLANEEQHFELATYIEELIGKFAGTFNCPSNWRSIGEELAEKYKNNEWVMDACMLYDYIEEDEEN